MSKNSFVFGSAKIANLPESIGYQIVSMLYENNVTEIDTAPSYGGSEALIGKIHRDFPNLKINSKVGLDSSNAFTSTQIKRSVYQSLERLQISSINTLFIHSVPSEYVNSSAFEALADLKKERVCNKIGYSGDGDDLLKIVQNQTIKLDAIMFTFNFLDQCNRALVGGEDIPGDVYIKRVLANGVWRRRTPKDCTKDLMGRTRGHEEYRRRMKKMYPYGIERGYQSSINFVRGAFPGAKYIVGVSNLKQCKELIDFMGKAEEPDNVASKKHEEIFFEETQNTYLAPLT